MRTQTVKKVKIVGPLSQEQKIIQTIHEEGVLHIEKVSEENQDVKIRGSQEGVQKVSQLLLELAYIKDATPAYKPQKPKQIPSQKEAVKNTKKFLRKHKEKIQELDTQKNQLKEELDILKNQRKKVRNIPQEFQQEKNLILFTSPYNIDQEELPKEGYIHVEEDKHYYVITSEKDSVLTSTFQENMATKVNLDFVQETPAIARKNIRKEIELVKEKIRNKQEEINSYVEPLQEEFSKVYTDLKNHYDRLTISNKFGKTDTLLIIEGYAEPRDCLEIAKKLPSCNVYTENMKDAPTKLKNKWFTKSFQPLTEMFDTPAYKKYDPTSFVAFFYPLFFGIMLSDIGYGLMLLALLPFIKTFFDQDVSDYMNILGASAVSTILFGVLFGSFFGDLIPLEPLLLEPFTDSFTILILSLILGLIHMNIGVGISFYQHSKDNSDTYTMAKDVLPLPLLQIAALILYLGETALGLFLIAIAVFLLLAKKGLLGVLDITDYIGTWFSYSRILALALATAGIALAVNLITQKIASLGTIGFILAPIILIGGHIFNFIINTLGCAINAARLHYVEFFSLFFKGGGEQFKPFKLTTPQP